MTDADKSKRQLIEELADLRRQVADFAKSKAVLEATIEHLPFDFWVLGADGRYTMQNGASKAHWGDRLGMTPAEAAPDGKVLALWQANNRRAFAGQKVHEEATLTANGQQRFLYNVIVPVRLAEQITSILGVNIDMTEQKRAEAALRDSEERFRKVFEEGPVGVLLVDTDGAIQRCNRRFCEMLGYSEDEIIARGLAGISHHDDWQRDYPYVSRLWRGEIPYYHVEKRYLRKDGQAVWTELTVSLMHDAAGKPVNNIGMVRDITDRKQAEEELKQAHQELEERVRQRTAELSSVNQQLEAVYDGMSDGLLVADIETRRFVCANTAIGRMLGYSQADFRALSVTDIHPQEARPLVAELFAAMARGELEVSEELPVLRKDGTLFYASICGRTLSYDDRSCVVGLFRDITERKRTQEALKESEQRYRELVANLGEGLGIADLQECFTFANPAAERLFGVPPGGLVGRAAQEFLTADQCARFLEQSKIRQTGEKTTYELEIVRPDGESRSLLITGVPNLDRAGRFIGTWGLFFDITQNKQAQKALEREHRTLKHLLQSSDHERQTIAYEIHDGLAQYLAGALMQFDVHEHLKEINPREAAKAYEAGVTMLRQGHYEARRLISGVRPPILDEAGVVAAISHLVNEHTRRRGPKIAFRSSVDFHRLVPILENAIYRITQEALTNACKYSKSSKVLVRLAQHGPRLRIEVQDRGVGFKPDEVGENRYGLAGIRERARLLGGTLAVDSRLGKGTRVMVELPVVLRSQAEEET
jgi:PAS domain S-box-containing protein